ncbi:MAG: hypothetical protein DWQ05_06340 [Calditrichaeota bacterium]|nr:MAG: hypothetical protein DWQ05_06340 [Calditrichota bacterium]
MKVGVCFVLITGLALLNSCGKVVSPEHIDEKVEVNNNIGQLNAHLQKVDAVQLPFKAVSKNSSELNFLLHADVAPLQWGDKILHAVHVTLNGDFAYVAYATPQQEYVGGVEIINIAEVSQPKILSRMIFTEADITIVMQSENRVFVGGAANSDKIDNISSPAVFAIVELDAGLLTGNYEIFDLPSYNANDIVIVDQTALITTGTTNGGLAIFDLHNKKHAFTPVNGAKALEVSRDGIYVMEGTGTKLHSFSTLDTAFMETISLGCDNMFQSKAETDLKGDILFFSSGACGLKAIDLQTKEICYEYAIPGGGHCNGVSVNDSLVFLANDTSGLAVLKIDAEGLELLGSISFGASVNYVISRGNKLFVAAAEEGLKIIEITPEP